MSEKFLDGRVELVFEGLPSLKQRKQIKDIRWRAVYR